jgi:hypothetical protein
MSVDIAFVAVKTLPPYARGTVASSNVNEKPFFASGNETIPGLVLTSETTLDCTARLAFTNEPEDRGLIIVGNC